MSITRILVSQHEPSNMAAYNTISEKYGTEFTFRPFFSIEPLTSREFRGQRINLLDYTAVVFSSRHAIDAYFSLATELRYKIPETMKYFCTTEAVAMYLQKHIVYRKRKIFFGNGTPESILELIGAKHNGEKFLITTSDTSKADAITRLFVEKGLDCTAAAMIKSVVKDLSDVDLHSFDIVVVYNSSDVDSLKSNFPDFKQDGLKFLSFGRSVVPAMEKAGLDISMKGPSPECPSAAKLIEEFLKK